MFNDIFAILSVIGSAVLLLGAFAPIGKFGEIANWSIGGLIFGGAFQVCIMITGMQAEKIGILVRMPMNIVTSLFILSLMLLIGRWQLCRLRYRFQ